MHVLMLSWLKGKPVPVVGYGGVERHQMTVARELCRQGHEVTLIAPHGSTSEFCEVIQTNDMVEACNIINSLSADVVHDNTVWDLASPVRQGIRHPHISVTHVNDAIGFTHNVVYMSKSQRSKHGLQLGRNLDESPVVYCPIDPALKPKGLPKCEYLLYLGAVTEYKGVYEAAQVARILNRNLMIAGNAAGAYADRIENDFPEVVWLGEVSGDYKHELIEQAYAMCCLHNNYGGWSEPGAGNVGEAMAFNTPVAAFPNGCLAEMVVTGENGWMTENVEDMTEIMTSISYPRNFEHYQETWSAENIVHQYVNLYEQVIEGKVWG